MDGHIFDVAILTNGHNSRERAKTNANTIRRVRFT